MNRSITDGVKLHKAGRLEEAAEIYKGVLENQPDNGTALYLLGVIADQVGEFGFALALIEKAIQYAPYIPQYHATRGMILRRQGRFEEALAALGHALRLNPDLVEAHNERGIVLQSQGRLTEALAALDHALRLNPDLAEVHVNRGSVFKDQGRFGDALAAFDHARRLKPDLAEAHSNYLLCLSYDPAQDDDALFEAHRAWGERFGRSPRAYTAYSNVPDPDKTLVVGLVSAEFGRAPIGWFTESTVAAVNPSRVRFLCYSGRQNEDDVTDRIRPHAAGWRSTIGVSDQALAEAVRADGVDILIDLAGHLAGNRLGCFALRPAPVLVHWAGSTHTIPAVDYSLWDWVHVPEGEERWFLETVVRLPDARLCYTPPYYAPDVVDPPVLERGRITFASFNNLTKVNAGVVALWAQVLKAVPGSRLLLNWRNLMDRDQRERLTAAFAARGIDPNRLDLRPGEPPHAGVLGEYGDVDIALDTFPFSGCTTTCEALWMGVPVVTLPSTRPVGRQSQAFLHALGRREWVARDEDEYLRIAVDLAADPGRLATLRRAQRSRMAASPLCDGPRFARHFEAALRAIWRAWCADQTERAARKQR